MKKEAYNIAILGKSGVGKSSFINYIFGEKISPTGTGTPVTEIGFHPYEREVEDLLIRIYDSWGIEIDKVDLWKELLSKELQNRGVDKDFSEWFHSIFYCISTTSGRVEQFELDLINMFLEKKYKVIVIFTKSDGNSNNQAEKLLEILNEKLIGQVSTVNVCNEDKILLGGRQVKKFGKEEVLNEIMKNFWESISLRIPQKTINALELDIKNWAKEAREKIASNENSDVGNELTESLQELIQKIENLDAFFDNLSETINAYHRIKNNIEIYPHLPNNKYANLIEEVHFKFHSEYSDLRKKFNGFLGVPYIFSGFGIILTFLLPVFLNLYEKTKLLSEIKNAEIKLISEVYKLSPILESLLTSLKFKE